MPYLLEHGLIILEITPGAQQWCCLWGKWWMVKGTGRPAIRGACSEAVTTAMASWKSIIGIYRKLALE